MRDTNNVQRKKRKKKMPILGLESTMQLTVVLTYLNTLQSGGNALGGSFLKTNFNSIFGVL
jgi:hypothetical protein